MRRFVGCLHILSIHSEVGQLESCVIAYSLNLYLGQRPNHDSRIVGSGTHINVCECCITQDLKIPHLLVICGVGVKWRNGGLLASPVSDSLRPIG